jgi:hypothetical protein
MQMAQQLAPLAGSFWADINTDKTVHHLGNARLLAEEQTQHDLNTLKLFASRETTPLYRRVLLQPIKVRRSELVDNVWEHPIELVHVAAVTDTLLRPQLIWLDSVNFIVDDKYITFINDPFEYVTDVEPVYDHDGHVIDGEITLWLHAADYDEGYLNDVWGAAVGLNAPSSAEYRTLLCVIYDALVGGTSRKHIEQVVSLFSGAALALGSETVVESAKDSKGLFLATDKHIYRPIPSGQPVVTVGTQLKAGDPLFDTCAFYRTSDPQALSNLTEITLPSSFLDARIGSDLTFQNREVPLINSNGRVQFEVGGQPDALDRFWNLLNARRLPDNRHLADLLTSPTINPCKFVLQHVLGNNCLLCIRKSPQTPAALSDIDMTVVLRQLVPPHEALLIIG